MAKNRKAEDRTAQLAVLIEKGAEALAHEVLDLQEELAAANSDEALATLKAQLAETTEKLQATEATKGNAMPVVKLKGGMHQINGGVRHKGEILTPE